MTACANEQRPTTQNTTPPVGMMGGFLKAQTQNMEIELVKLSPETVFKYKGVTYRSTTLYWTADAAKRASKYQYTGVDSADLAQVVSVVPKYGGRFQPELSVYIDSKTLVEVEP